MKTVAVTKIGKLNDPDPAQRGRVEVIDFPQQPLGNEDVRIRIAYSSICGSDPHVVAGAFRTDVPFGLGHELSGVVSELGPGATHSGLKVGDRVACNFLKFCGSCIPCRDGRQQFCEFLHDDRRPGLSEEVVWHESQVYKLPDQLSLLDGCMLEPTSIAVRIADKASIRSGDRVAVSGGGPIGQLAMQVLRLSGATDLTLIEPIASRREVALQGGAQHVIDPIAEDIHQRTSQITDGRGYDVVVDVSGSPHAVANLLDIVRPGGKVIYGAMYPADFELPVNLYRHCYQRELTITGVYLAPYAFPRAVALLPMLNLEPFTRAVFPLDEAAKAFDVHMSGEFPKVIIQCNEVTE